MKSSTRSPANRKHLSIPRLERPPGTFLGPVPVKVPALHGRDRIIEGTINLHHLDFHQHVHGFELAPNKPKIVLPCDRPTSPPDETADPTQ